MAGRDDECNQQRTKHRAELVERRVENQRKESQARADALRAMLEPMKEVDWRTLMAAQSGGLDARQLIALAFRDLADKAGSIGNLNISPELLTSLMSMGGADGNSAPTGGEEADNAQSRGKKIR